VESTSQLLVADRVKLRRQLEKDARKRARAQARLRVLLRRKPRWRNEFSATKIAIYGGMTLRVGRVNYYHREDLGSICECTKCGASRFYYEAGMERCGGNYRRLARGQARTKSKAKRLARRAAARVAYLTLTKESAYGRT